MICFPPSPLIKAPSFLVLFLLFITSQSLSPPLSQPKFQTLHQKTMKVHPLPKKRNTTTFLSSNDQNPSSHKKLRRLPHIFARVLELPFRSDADVSVEEGPDCFRFVAETEEVVAGGVRAHMVEIHPGVTKIVVRPNGYLGFSSLDELELDVWRFRLPESTRPDLASAVFVGGELVVTVPKGVEEENGGGEFIGGVGDSDNSNRARIVVL